MLRSTLLRGVSAGAFTLAHFTASALAQEALPSIDISADRGAATGGEKTAKGFGSPADKEIGYARSTSFAAAKTDTPLLDTPVSVQIIPREVIEDKQILSAMEAVKNVSGVQASPGTYYDQYQIRGFAGSPTFRNGLQISSTWQAVDTAFTERVEVVKGPSSVLYGRLEPGGFVNVVTKKPQEEFKASLEEQAGSWGLSRTIADVTGPANAEKTLLYRMIGVYDRADSFVDFDHRNNGAAALYLTYRPTSNFEFNTQFEHYERKMTSPDGNGWIPVTGPGTLLGVKGFVDQPLNLPRHFSISDPALWSDFPDTHHRTLYGYDWTYRFDDKWKITNRFHYVDTNEVQSQTPARAFDGASTYLIRAFYYAPYRRQELSTNLDLTGEIETGPIKHRILAGTDWRYYGAFLSGRAGPEPVLGPLNVYAPVYGGIDPTLHYLVDSTRANMLFRFKERDFGVYAQDQISLFDDRLHIMLGGRYDKAGLSQSTVYGWKFADCYPNCTGYPQGVYPDKPMLSPRAGVLFKLTDNVSVYGSYVRSFGSNNSANLTNGEAPPPQVGLQWEAGVKSQWLDGKVTASATLFDLRKKNVLEPDPTNPDFQVAVGEVRSRGLELDLAGQVTDNLSVIASYTYDVAKITNDNGNGNQGNWYNGVAPHVANLWAKWDTAPRLPEGFEFGAGYYASSGRWGDDANTWKLPSYATFDAMAAYRMSVEGHKVTFRFNVKNIGDVRYFAYTDKTTNAYYGDPRTFIGSVKFEF